MRRLVLLLSILPFCLLQAEPPVKLMTDMPAIVYSLPRTQLCFDVEIERVTSTPGVFYLYSQRYLATDKVIQVADESFRLKNISLDLQAVPDPERTFVISPLPENTAKFVQLNEQGVLKGINLSGENLEKRIHKKIIRKEEQGFMTNSDLLPLTEEYMQAGSEAKMAEGAAKQIYHLRESRINLLSGELENLPQDGKSLEIMLKGINRAENELTELFVGKTTSQTIHRKICLVPDSIIEDDVLFRFSPKMGMMNSEDLSGSPVYISLEVDSVHTTFPDPKMKMPALSYYTIIPAKSRLMVKGEGLMLRREIELPQLGELVPLSLQIFQEKTIQVKIDENTGRLLEIKH